MRVRNILIIMVRVIRMIMIRWTMLSVKERFSVLLNPPSFSDEDGGYDEDSAMLMLFY